MTTTTKNERRAVWERYTASRRAKTSAEKRALFETCLARACVYTDPPRQRAGVEGIATAALRAEGVVRTPPGTTRRVV